MTRGIAMIAILSLILAVCCPAALAAQRNTLEGVALIVRASDYIRQPATDFQIPYVAANLMGDGRGLTLDAVQLIGADGAVLDEIRQPQALVDIAYLAATADALFDLLGDETQPADRRDAARSAISTGHLVVPNAVERFGLKVGDRVTLTVRAQFSKPDGSSVVREAVVTEAYLMSLPAPTNYHAGDTHVHCSEYGDDGWDTISQQATEGMNRGYRWMTMTPHAQMMQSSSWTSYCSSCRGITGITVAPSLEISTRHEYSLATTSWGYRTPGGTKITSWTGNSDDGYYSTTIGFDFPFYGSTRTSIYVSTNGFLTFSSAGANSASNVAIPNTNTPNGMIAPFWRDLNPGDGGEVWVDKSVPNIVYVTWYNVPIYGTSYRQTFQVRFDSAGVISFYYQTVSTPGSPTVGIEDSRGEYGVAYTGSLISSLARKFTIDSDSHYLSHDVDAFVTNPNPENRTGEEIINAVKNSPYNGFGVIAHPYSGSYPWRYWTKKSGSSDVRVTGFRGMELLTGGTARAAPSSALSKWDSLLLADLPSTIAGNGFVAGIAGSDDHDILELSLMGYHMTWVYTTSLTESAVLSALKAGKAFASSDGSVSTFALTYGSTYQVGAVVNIVSGASFTLSGTAYGADGSAVTSVTVYRNGTYAATPTLSNGSWSYTTSTTSDCYYRIVLTTFDGIGYNTSYSNPIFVNI